MAEFKEYRQGLTVFGSDNEPHCALAINSKSGTASGLVFKSPDGSECYMWFQDDGKLYAGTRDQFEAQSGGFSLW